jgi:hypothetical protein
MKKVLYIVYVPLLLIEWVVDLIGKMWDVFHKSIITITLAIETYINEPDRPKPSD